MWNELRRRQWQTTPRQQLLPQKSTIGSPGVLTDSKDYYYYNKLHTSSRHFFNYRECGNQLFRLISTWYSFITPSFKVVSMYFKGGIYSTYFDSEQNGERYSKWPFAIKAQKQFQNMTFYLTCLLMTSKFSSAFWRASEILVESVSDLPALKPSRIRLKAYNLKKSTMLEKTKIKTKTTSTSNEQSQNLDWCRKVHENPTLTHVTMYSTVSVVINNDDIYNISQHVG